MRRFPCRRRVWLFSLTAGIFISCSAAPPPTLRIVEGRPERTPYISPDAYEYYVRAEIALENGDVNEATAYFRDALDHDATSSFLFSRLAIAELRADHREAAEIALDRAEELNPHQPDALLVRAHLAVHDGEMTKARAVFEHALTANPAYAPVYIEYATFLRTQLDFKSAAAVLGRLTALHPQDRDAWVELARACVLTLDFVCANRSYERALGLHADVAVRLEAAHVAQAIGDDRRAIHYFQFCLERSSAASAADIARRLIRLLKAHNATREIDELLAAAAANPQEFPNAIKVELELLAERPELAIKRLDADNSWPVEFAALSRARALELMDHDNDALSILEREYAHQPSIIIALAIAQKRTERSEYEEAARQLRTALEVFPQEFSLIGALADALVHQGKRDQAIALISRHMTPTPAKAESVMHLAVALHRAGQPQHAISFVEHAFPSLEPTGELHNLLGYLLADANIRLDDAAEHLKRAHLAKPQAAHIIDSIGWLKFRQNHWTQSEEILTIAHRLARWDADILVHLADVKAAQGAATESVALYRQASTLNHDPLFQENLRHKMQSN